MNNNILFIDSCDDIYFRSYEEYVNMGNSVDFDEFLIDGDFGIEYIGYGGKWNQNTYIVINPQKYMLSRIKYGI